VCFGTRGVVLCQSCDVRIIQDAGGVSNMGGRDNGGVGGKKGNIYSTSCDFLGQLERYDSFDPYPAMCWLTNTKRPSLHLAPPPGTSCMRRIETRDSTSSEARL